MRKLIALLLIMLLLGMSAVAEEAQDTALVTFISNIELESGTGAPTRLDGFEAYLSIDTADGLALVGQAFNGDESLALAVAKLAGSQLKIGIDGLDMAYALDLPQLAGQDTRALGELFRPVLPELLDARLPMIDVPSLPKLDVTALLSMVNTAVSEDGTISFSVPHELIDGLLDQVVQIGSAYAQNVQGLSEALSLVEQLRESGTSVALRGTVMDIGDSQYIRAEIYPVTGGQTAESPAAFVNITSAQDTLSVAVNAADAVESGLASLDVMTDVEQNALSASLDIVDKMRYALGVYREDDLQKVTLTVESAGMNLAAAVKYGKNDGNDVTDFTLTAGEDFGLELKSETAPVSDVSNAGVFELTADVQGNHFRLNANVETFLGYLDLGGYTLPENTESIEALSEARDSAALQSAIQPLMEYIGMAFPGAAA